MNYHKYQKYKRKYLELQTAGANKNPDVQLDESKQLLLQNLDNLQRIIHTLESQQHNDRLSFSIAIGNIGVNDSRNLCNKTNARDPIFLHSLIKRLMTGVNCGTFQEIYADSMKDQIMFEREFRGYACFILASHVSKYHNKACSLDSKYNTLLTLVKENHDDINRCVRLKKCNEFEKYLYSLVRKEDEELEMNCKIDISRQDTIKLTLNSQLNNPCTSPMDKVIILLSEKEYRDTFVKKLSFYKVKLERTIVNKKLDEETKTGRINPDARELYLPNQVHNSISDMLKTNYTMLNRSWLSTAICSDVSMTHTNINGNQVLLFNVHFDGTLFNSSMKFQVGTISYMKLNMNYIVRYFSVMIFIKKMCVKMAQPQGQHFIITGDFNLGNGRFDEHRKTHNDFDYYKIFVYLIKIASKALGRKLYVFRHNHTLILSTLCISEIKILGTITESFASIHEYKIEHFLYQAKFKEQQVGQQVESVVRYVKLDNSQLVASTCKTEYMPYSIEGRNQPRIFNGSCESDVNSSIVDEFMYVLGYYNKIGKLYYERGEFNENIQRAFEMLRRNDVADNECEMLMTLGIQSDTFGRQLEDRCNRELFDRLNNENEEVVRKRNSGWFECLNSMIDTDTRLIRQKNLISIAQELRCNVTERMHRVAEMVADVVPNQGLLLSPERPNQGQLLPPERPNQGQLLPPERPNQGQLLPRRRGIQMLPENQGQSNTMVNSSVPVPIDSVPIDSVPIAPVPNDSVPNDSVPSVPIQSNSKQRRKFARKNKQGNNQALKKN